MFIVPIAGLRDQLTAVFGLPLTVAVNWLVWVCPRLALGGLSVTPMSFAVSCSMAEADLLGSAILTAVTVTIWGKATDAGAEYNPLEIVPTGGLIYHATPVLGLPLTVAVNWLV